MMEETLTRAQALLPGLKAVGLLATAGTVQSGIYRDVFARRGVTVMAPDAADQGEIMRAIRLIKADTYDRSRQDVFERIGARLVEAGAQAVVLGCTEIPLAFNAERAGYPVVNATRALAEAAVQWALGKRP
jgi:aspartate racemase